jgi:hypothetical protein
MPIQDTELSATELNLKQECIGAANEKGQAKADVDISRVEAHQQGKGHSLGASYQARAHAPGMTTITGVGNTVALALKNLLERMPVQ